MIKYVTGNFFDYDANIRVNTVNCVGVMGAGVALQFKKKFPDMFKDYYKACKHDEVKPGKPHVWVKYDLFSELTIINFPTKVHWKNPSEYEYVEKGLNWLRDFLRDKNESVVTLPALGCGHGGLEWERVKELIHHYLDDVNAEILVFEPSSSRKISKNDEIDEKSLVENNITRIFPGDELYPKKLLGRSALELFCKGNCDLLRNKSIAVMINSKASIREVDALHRVLDELPRHNIILYLGLNNSKEIDLAKDILLMGFSVVFIVPQGILNLQIRKDLLEIWNYDKLAIVSTVNPNQMWKRYESSKALKLRFQLANNILINNIDIENINRFRKDFKQSGNKIFYVNYWKQKYELFEDLSAKKIGISAETGRPNILPLVQNLNLD